MASLSGFTEMGIGIMLILFCLGIAVYSLNSDYDTNLDGTFGINTSATETEFNNYQGTLQESMEGEATTNSVFGVNVATSWGAVSAGLKMVMNFVTGGFIQDAVGLLNWGSAGTALGLSLRLLFIFALGFIFIKLLFKVNP